MQSAFNNATFKKIAAAVERSTGVNADKISLSTRLGEDLALDRFSRLSFAAHLRECHDIEVSVVEMEQFASIADIVTYSSRQYFKDVKSSGATMAA